MPIRVLTVTGTSTARGHGGDAARHQVGLGHQAGAEAGVLHAAARAADVQVDLVIAEALADLGAARQRIRIGAAELQGDRMLGRIEAQEAVGIAVQDRARRDHLGVEPHAARDQAQKVALVPIGPRHHRRDAKAVARGHRGHVDRLVCITRST